jgi:hypothetical protein
MTCHTLSAPSGAQASTFPVTTAPKLPTDFQAGLEALPAAPVRGGWRCDCSQIAWGAWTTAAIEFCDLPGDQGYSTTDVALAFRSDLTIRYIRECRTDDEDGGCLFHGYLFTVPGRLQVVAWIEDDLIHAWMVYRGEPELVEEIGFQAKMFEGHCFTGSAAPQAPYQHIVRVRS